MSKSPVEELEGWRLYQTNGLSLFATVLLLVVLLPLSELLLLEPHAVKVNAVPNAIAAVNNAVVFFIFDFILSQAPPLCMRFIYLYHTQLCCTDT